MGESHSGTDIGNLLDYLHFEESASGNDTIVKISTDGAFADGYDHSKVDQSITLESVSLTDLGVSGGDQQIIQQLLQQGKLITD